MKLSIPHFRPFSTALIQTLPPVVTLVLHMCGYTTHTGAALWLDGLCFTWHTCKLWSVLLPLTVCQLSLTSDSLRSYYCTLCLYRRKSNTLLKYSSTQKPKSVEVNLEQATEEQLCHYEEHAQNCNCVWKMWQRASCSESPAVHEQAAKERWGWHWYKNNLRSGSALDEK